MDADDLPAEIYAAVVADLAQVNVVTMAARPTLALPRRGSRARARRSGCSTSASATATCFAGIARWAEQRGIAVELVGVDLNPRSEQAARAHTPAGLPIRWITGDYADLAGGGWDAVISSLVAHHMTRDAAGRVPAVHGRRVAARLAGQRSPPPRLRASRLSGARARVRLAPDRPPRRAAVDRAQLPPGRMGADPRRGGRRRRARVPRLPVPPVRRACDDARGDRRRRTRRARRRRSRWRAAATRALAARANARDRRCAVRRVPQLAVRWRRSPDSGSTPRRSAAPITRARLFAGDRVAESPLPRPRARCRGGASTRCCSPPPIGRARASSAASHVRAIEASTDRRRRDAADALFLATGKHDLRGLARPVEPDRSDARAARPALPPPRPGAAGRRCGRAPPVRSRLCRGRAPGGRQRQRLPRGAAVAAARGRVAARRCSASSRTRRAGRAAGDARRARRRSMRSPTFPTAGGAPVGRPGSSGSATRPG